ncbi:hypothetical protein EDC01DRAFT_339858 [Geopyxis carbonaria]|nr:hypothetical protein EDC01DRAFT_339858 [Geopyxis carbonaria]
MFRSSPYNIADTSIGSIDSPCPVPAAVAGCAPPPPQPNPAKDKFRCEICYTRFPLLNALKLHMEQRHSQGPRADAPESSTAPAASTAAVATDSFTSCTSAVKVTAPSDEDSDDDETACEDEETTEDETEEDEDSEDEEDEDDAAETVPDDMEIEAFPSVVYAASDDSDTAADIYPVDDDEFPPFTSQSMYDLATWVLRNKVSDNELMEFLDPANRFLVAAAYEEIPTTVEQVKKKVRWFQAHAVRDYFDARIQPRVEEPPPPEVMVERGRVKLAKIGSDGSSAQKKKRIRAETTTVDSRGSKKQQMDDLDSSFARQYY